MAAAIIRGMSTSSLSRQGLVAAFVTTLGTVGCGGSPSKPPSEPGQGGAASQETPGSEAEQCLSDARADREPGRTEGKIGVSHILVRHTGLKDPRGATRTAGQACLRALTALRKLTEGELSWPDAVSTYSDSPSDDLGRVAYDELSTSFANAAFTLDIDELSYVVESDRGFHVIWRTE